MTDLPDDLLADLDPDFHPLFGDKTPPSRHVVKEHDRHLPPKPDPIDPDQLTIPGMPERLPPQPRVTTVKKHVRRNPRPKKETHEMTTIQHSAETCPGRPCSTDCDHVEFADASTCLPPETRTDVTDMKDALAVTARPDLTGIASARNSDPATSHAAASAAQGSLRRRMADVLYVFKREDNRRRNVEPHRPEGLTDDELAVAFESALTVRCPISPASPSGIRTARKDLERLGLLQPLYEGVGCTPEMVTRPTRLGNQAAVFVLTEAGRDYPLPQS